MKLGEHPKELNFPSDEALIDEMFIVMGIMRFPDDEAASKLYSRLVREDWLSHGRPVDSWDSNRLLEAVETGAQKRISKGYSAGTVCNYIHFMMRSGMTPSLNKAAFLASEEALENGPILIEDDGSTRRYPVMTDVKKIAQNFRLYRKCAHYWGAALIKTHPQASVLEDTRYVLHTAERIREQLCCSDTLQASSWGMRVCPPGLVYTSVGGPGGPSGWQKTLEGYRNPNWGYLE